MTHLSDNELLVDLRAKRDWLHSHPTGMAASTTKRRMREIKRELESRGVDIESELRSQRPRLGLSMWYVVDAKESDTKRKRHLDLTCMHLADSRVREATEYERKHLPPCETCA